MEKRSNVEMTACSERADVAEGSEVCGDAAREEERLTRLEISEADNAINETDVGWIDIREQRNRRAWVDCQRFPRRDGKKLLTVKHGRLTIVIV